MTDLTTPETVRSLLSKIRPAGHGNELLELVRDLLRDKHSGNTGFCAIEGLWAFEQLAAGRVAIRVFLFCPAYIETPREKSMVEKLIDLADASFTISEKQCRRLSGRDEPEGFFLLCVPPTADLGGPPLAEAGLLLVLDGLEKPGNIGTIIRSGEGAACDGAILCDPKVRLTNPRLIKASMGATLTLPLTEVERGTLIAWLLGNHFRILLADAAAVRHYYEVDYTGRIAVVVGNERYGIPRSWYEAGGEKIAVPMLGRGDSLNVATAAAIVIYEASLRRKGWLRRD